MTFKLTESSEARSLKQDLMLRGCLKELGVMWQNQNPSWTSFQPAVVAPCPPLEGGTISLTLYLLNNGQSWRLFSESKSSARYLQAVDKNKPK